MGGDRNWYPRTLSTQADSTLSITSQPLIRSCSINQGSSNQIMIHRTHILFQINPQEPHALAHCGTYVQRDTEVKLLGDVFEGKRGQCV